MNRITILLAVTAVTLSACDSGPDDSPPEQNLPPSIGSISTKLTPANESSTAVSFTLADETPDQVTVVALTSNDVLLPADQIVLEGQGANRTVVVRPVDDLVGDVRVTLVATDPLGQTGERQFDVTILAQNRSIQAFARENLALDGNGRPVLINAIRFEEDAEHDDFADLFD